jgi:hypothetical protein
VLTEYLARGVKAGLVAGLVFGVFVALVANPLVGFADGAGHGADEHTGAEGQHESAVSATVNHAVSVVAGGLWGVLLGAVVFGVCFYFLEPTLPGTGATKSFVLAGLGFVTVSGAPWLVLPPRPPGVEQSLATGTRISLYAGAMVAGAAVCLLSVALFGRLVERRGRLVASLAAVLPFGLLAVPALLAPTNAVTHGLSTDLAAGVVGLVVFGQLLVWFLLAATHAWLAPTADATTVSSATSLGATAD